MQIPFLALHELKGERRSTWALTVLANWRIAFRFENGEVEIVENEDYH
jgi:proteic killer suppression protein